MRSFLRLVVLVPLALAAGCRSHPAAQPQTARPLGYAPLLQIVNTGTDEARYHALLALARHDSAVVRARLRSYLAHEHALTRNAAARALVDLGEEDAAATLIANLHRSERTYVVTDAIYHLHALYGTDRGYEPNRGYRHQTEAQEAWWTWGEERGLARTPPPAEFDPNQNARLALAASLRDFVSGAADGEATDEGAAWTAAEKLWQDAGAIASSRHLDDVATVAGVFQALAARYPEHVSLQNNAALSALNDGREEKAEEAYARAIALEGEDPDLWNDYGILREARGRLDAAEEAYRRATELAPDDDIPWSNLGDVRRKRGRTDEARGAYLVAERLAPEKWYYHRLWQRRLGSVERRRLGSVENRRCSH